MLVAILATVGINCFGLDVNILATDYGVQNESIDRGVVEDILRFIANSANNYDTDTALDVLSSVLRAQLTAKGDTTLAGLGSSTNFATLFPFYTADVANQLKIVLDANSTPAQRSRAAKLIIVSQWMGAIHQVNGTALSGSIENDINGARRHDNATALLYAAFEGTPQTVKDLLDLGADKNIKLNNGSNAGPEEFARTYRQGGGDEAIASMIAAS